MANTLGRRAFPLFFLAVCGTLAVVLALQLTIAKPAYIGYMDKLAKREHVELTPSPIPAAWVISGSPVFRSNTFGGSPDGSTTTGIWECTGPTQFVWHYGTDETIYILEGSAEIEYLGKKFSVSAGDSTHFAAGTTANWVVRDRIKKTWTLYEPGRLTRLMRRIFN